MSAQVQKRVMPNLRHIFKAAQRGAKQDATVTHSKIRKIYARHVEYELEVSGQTTEMDFVLLEDGTEYCRARKHQQLRLSTIHIASIGDAKSGTRPGSAGEGLIEPTFKR